MTFVAAIVLAGGGSARMGRAKPLLLLRGETLVARAARAARGGGAGVVFVVAGGPDETAREGVIREAGAAGADVIVNPGWREGISTSIRAGLAAVESDPRIDGVIYLAADQPFVEAEDVGRLISAWEAGAPIAAADYGNGEAGVPALFGRRYFSALDGLEGDEGARKIVASERAAARLVPMPSASIDVDTPDDRLRWGLR